MDNRRLVFTLLVQILRKVVAGTFWGRLQAVYERCADVFSEDYKKRRKT
jgi:hypothetical protein